MTRTSAYYRALVEAYNNRHPEAKKLPVIEL